MTQITLLDGSIGQELVKRSKERPTPLWSTQVMIDHPELVGEVHSVYFDAGATVATTNTYAVHLSRLEPAGIADQLNILLDAALSQAAEARTKARARAGNGRIAGSLGPLLATYRPDLDPDPDEAAQKFAEIASRIAPRVDLLLIETVSSLKEAEGAMRGVGGPRHSRLDRVHGHG